MRILIDTSVWSLALRRAARSLSDEDRTIVAQVEQLVRDRRVLMVGPVRQELLSGIRDTARFQHFRQALRGFPDESLDTDDYELAAEYSNQCRRRGVAGSAIDFLLCAGAARRSAAIFTNDVDFRRFATILPIELHP